MIKLGTEQCNVAGIDKAYIGNELVYEKPIYAPATTTGLFHLDGNLNNEVSGGTNGKNNFTESASGKFNKCIRVNYNNSTSYTQFPIAMGTQGYYNDYWTIEFWAYLTSTTAQMKIRMVTNDNTGVSDFILGQLSSQGQYLNTNYRQTQTIISTPTPEINTWNHFAYVFDGGNYRFYFNGNKITEGTTTTYTNYNLQWVRLNVTGLLYDELLICHEAKYNADFTPNSRPYALRPTT